MGTEKNAILSSKLSASLVMTELEVDEGVPLIKHANGGSAVTERNR